MLSPSINLTVGCSKLVRPVIKSHRHTSVTINTLTNIVSDLNPEYTTYSIRNIHKRISYLYIILYYKISKKSILYVYA